MYVLDVPGKSTLLLTEGVLLCLLLPSVMQSLSCFLCGEPFCSFGHHLLRHLFSCSRSLPVCVFGSESFGASVWLNRIFFILRRKRTLFPSTPTPGLILLRTPDTACWSLAVRSPLYGAALQPQLCVSQLDSWPTPSPWGWPPVPPGGGSVLYSTPTADTGPQASCHHAFEGQAVPRRPHDPVFGSVTCCSSQNLGEHCRRHGRSITWDI